MERIHLSVLNVEMKIKLWEIRVPGHGVIYSELKEMIKTAEEEEAERKIKDINQIPLVSSISSLQLSLF